MNDEIGHNIIPPHKLSAPSSSDIHKLTSQQLKEYHIRLAISNFVKNLGAYGGILSQLNEFDRGLQITFPECPFCANDLPKCSILLGVVQGMWWHLLEIPPLIKDGSGKPFLM